jgi:putative transposase
MKRKRNAEEQIIAILKEREAGMKTADLCRKHGISEGASTTGKPSTAGSRSRKPSAWKGLESENAKLRALKDLLAKKW